MQKDFNPNRYSVINEKNKREIVMLIGTGCTWRRCRFCDYHLDHDTNEDLIFKINCEQLAKVTGIYGKLEVINSGSFAELDKRTMSAIEEACRQKGITRLHFEAHWSHREQVPVLKRHYSDIGITVKTKVGIETFDSLFRESYLDKGIYTDDPNEIARYFDECCLLQGIPGQTEQSMKTDIETGLKYFERVCVNIMQENIMPVKPDPRVIAVFNEKILPVYKDDYRIDILTENTAFGVGGAI